MRLTLLLLAILFSGLLPAEEVHWSLHPFSERALPVLHDGKWPVSRVDHFILHRIEQAGIAPNAEADNATLLRRVYFDLIGLPPSLEDAAAFEIAAKNDRSTALAAIVDRLLASPDFGARWGRHWLDVARYAESTGNTRNMAYVEAWRYRNYVVRALNRNVRFDQFVREQLAGDLLPAATPEMRDEQLLATGFLTIGTKSLGEQDVLTYELNLADDQIDATSRAFLATTASCARCHDHKFDPIPARDYYAMAGIFRSTRIFAAVQTNNRKEEAEGIPLGANGRAQMEAVKEHAKQSAEVQKDYEEVAKKRNAMRDELVKAGFPPAQMRAKLDTLPKEVAEKITTVFALDASVEEWKARLKKMTDSAPQPPAFAMAAQEREKPLNCLYYSKGDPKKPQDEVPRGTLSAVPVALADIPPQESGRRQLAEWIVSPRNPLTARVIVNRVWLHVFGRALVGTPDDFGVLGEKPTHPELLDDLAARFVRDGWDVKALIRELMLSRTYRLASDITPAAAQIDPVNALLGRTHRKPLEAEPLRDTALFLGGELRREIMEGSTVTELVRDVKPDNRELGRKGLLDNIADTHTYRSVYLPVLRGSTLPVQQCFDVADPNGVTGLRRATIVPAQSLLMMNSEQIMRLAGGMARRVLAEKAASLDERIALAWRMAFTRNPAADETASLRKFLAARPNDAEAWAMACQALMMAGEFRTLY